MKYKILSNLTCPLKIKTIPKCIYARHASTGLKYWNEALTTEHKREIEKYWKDKIHKTSDNETKDKFYVLSMFPYPSGSLHMGHVRVYTISDSVARFYRMHGNNVIHPMGWDAFGLPAENAAIEKQIDPDEWTKQNIQIMRDQLNRLGCTFDTHRELSTCDPEYYKWTQQLFLMLYENGLLYRKEAFVNWDPIDETVLADEQVDENNRSWRSGAVVEKKLLKQWFVKTTAFAESLLEGLKDRNLKEWRDIIKIQEHWIGECTGTNIEFELISDIEGYPTTLTLWTDKPEYIEYAKFLALSKNNLLAKIENFASSDCIRKLNIKAVNPFTHEQLPIYITEKDILPYPAFRDDYLGIPYSSEADIAFCESNNISYEPLPVYSMQELEEKRFNILCIARERGIGGYLVSPKLKDWLISRQRYWGTPIPMVHCKKCGCQPVTRDQLPVKLPKIHKSSTNKKLTLKFATEWMETFCPKCKGSATRETDTMDTFVDSSWYYMRYIDPKNKNEMFSKDKSFQYLPVDLYIGGKEHAVLHLYYARFINHFLYHLGLVPSREPFKQLLVQGMVKGQSHCTEEGKYLKPYEVTITENGHIETSSGKSIVTTWEKMSKSKHNGVDPSEIISEYSADTVRLLILADVAPTSHRHWSKETFPGILNWQRRLWHVVREFIEARTALSSEELSKQPDHDEFFKEDAYMFDSRNYYVHGVTFNFTGSQQLSVAISKLQGLTNSIRKSSKHCIARSREYERALAVQIIMLAPLAPHFASELWAGFCLAPHRIVHDGEIQWDKDVLEQRWPEVDMEYKLKIRVQVNGKEYPTLRIARRQLDNMTKNEVLELVMEQPKFQKHITHRKITSFIYRSERGCGANISIRTKNNVVLPEKETN